MGYNNSLRVNSGIDSNKIWFGTNNTRIYYSSNYGQSWVTQSTAPEQHSLCVTMGGNTGYTGGSNYLLKTTNYGMSWVQETVGGSGNITGVANLAWDIVLTRGNRIYIWNGGNWNTFYTPPSGIYNYVDNLWGGNWSDHYAVRTNGVITYLMEGEGVKRISSTIPAKYNLNQNYPNPFNPTTKIKLDLPQFPITKGGQRGLFTRLVIYDPLGRTIAELVNQELNPGTYSVDWNATNFPSGIYFYSLQAGDFIETRKMVLVR